MSSTALIPAILLAACSVALIGYLLWSIFGSLFSGGLGWAYRQKLARKERALAAADVLIKNGSFLEALPILKEAFLFDQVPRNPVLIEGISHHHLSIVSRLIAISERTSSHIPNLAVVEDLLSTRSQLQRTLFEALEAKKSLKRRRKEKKELPQWALAEYENKAKETLDRLETNRKSLNNKLAEIFSALASAPSSQEVTYH
ncbi:MAG: hypothetical protein J0M12_00110 [Deltaproteobacteria bacterium]|nr:hypothetical protein [Deltaproteobacteria bacterium]